jgi:hypothetical protein
MKTTLILRDELVRRAKARAALRGQALSRYMEESLERSLREDEKEPATAAVWLSALPKVSQAATKELKAILATSSFRAIDEEMWR